MSKIEDYIKLGECKKPHGIKGGFLFQLVNPEDSILLKKSKIKLIPLNESSSINKNGEEFVIDSIHFGNKTVCYFGGIKDRNIVEAMLPFEILYPRSLFPELDNDEWYISDIVGLKVMDPDGKEVGIVDSYFDNGAQICLKVITENNKYELPFVEAFFPKVDMENKTIVMIEPEYD